MQIEGRSYLRGEVTLEELLTLTAGFKHVEPLLQAEFFSDEFDAVVVDGDLHVASLSLGEGTNFLVVTGNLTVDGACTDYDDPPTGLYVLGNMQAGSVFTCAMLGVQGDLRVERTLAGSYNDYFATVHGTTQAAVFYPENHAFHFVGEPTFGHVLGEQAGYRVPEAWRHLMAETLFGRALLDRSPCEEGEEVEDCSDEEIETWGATELLDSESVYERVKEDLPVLVD